MSIDPEDSIGNQFTKFLVSQEPRYNALILQDEHPTDEFLGIAPSKPAPIRVYPTWWLRRELVRKIAEGLSYQPTVENPE